MSVVIFTAPCPECGRPATWQQTAGNGYAVTPSDFTIKCRRCDKAASLKRRRAA